MTRTPRQSIAQIFQIALLCTFLLGASAFTATTPVHAEENGTAAPCSCPHCSQETTCSCQETVCGYRPQDEIWLVDTRRAPCCLDEEEAATPTISFFRYDHESDSWDETTSLEFFQSESNRPNMPTTFWVHGDRINESDAYEVGLSVYQRLMECADPSARRYVIWSWPAEVNHLLPVKDSREKGERARIDGFRLGWVLSRFSPEAEVGLIGYSFAARVISGGLHILGGGTIDDYAVERKDTTERRHSVIMFAGGMDNDWFEPEEEFSEALTQVEHMRLIINYDDHILRFYPKIGCSRCGSEALGYTGIYDFDALGPLADRVSEIDVSSELGGQHRWKNYVFTDYTMDMLRQYGIPQTPEMSVETTTDRATAKSSDFR